MHCLLPNNFCLVQPGINVLRTNLNLKIGVLTTAKAMFPSKWRKAGHTQATYNSPFLLWHHGHSNSPRDCERSEFPPEG